MSSLNPYAASYVPLSKREDADKNAFEISSGSKIVDTDGWSKNSSEGQETEANQLPGEASLDFNVHGIEELLNSMDLTQKSHMDDNSHDSLSCNPSYATEKHNTYDDFEMDLAYLATMFPSLSDQSLVDVYSANAGDLEASVDMLHQLEVYPADASQHLPDSLDIGDVPGFESPDEEEPSIRLNTSGEASGSSSCPLPSTS